MATAAIAGYKGALMFSTSTGGTVARAAELTDWNLNISHSEIDATSHDSSGTREVIAGIDQWEGGADMLHVMSSGAGGSANAVFDLITSKTKVDFEFYPTGSSADGYYSGEGFFTGFDISSPNEDALATSLSFVGSGQLTRGSSA